MLFVRTTYFAGTRSPTSCFLFPAMIPLILFSGAAFKEYVIKQEISIGSVQLLFPYRLI